jgi:hypothetical protein
MALQPGALEHLDLLRVVHHRRESVFVEQRQVVGLEEALEHQDRLLHAGDAQPRRFLEIENRKAVGGGQRARRALDAVAVRVGLDDRPDLRAAGVLSRYCQIMSERGCGDRGADRPGHGGLLCYKAPRREKKQAELPGDEALD